MLSVVDRLPPEAEPPTPPDARPLTLIPLPFMSFSVRCAPVTVAKVFCSLARWGRAFNKPVQRSEVRGSIEVLRDPRFLLRLREPTDRDPRSSLGHS